MTAVFTFWTGTPRFTLRITEAIVACLCVRLASKNVGDTILFTDRKGAEIMNALGIAFDFVCDSHDDLTKATKCPQVWALGKLWTAAQCSEGRYMHLDFDVLWSKPPSGRITSAPLFAQSIDWPHYYENKDARAALSILDCDPGAIAYNMGVFGGHPDLLSEWAKDGIRLSDRLAGLNLCGTSASMVIEQHRFGEMAAKHNITPETVCSFPSPGHIPAIGYHHLHGSAKRTPKNVRELEARFPEYQEDIKRLESGWGKAIRIAHA